MKETYIECQLEPRPLTTGLSTFCPSYLPECSWTVDQSRLRPKKVSDKWPYRLVFSSTVSSCQLAWRFGLLLIVSYLFRMNGSFSMRATILQFTSLFLDIWMTDSWKCRKGLSVCNWPKRTILQERAQVLSDTCAGCLPIICIFQDSLLLPFSFYYWWKFTRYYKNLKKSKI